MKSQDSEVTVSAIGQILIVRENLINDVAIHSQVYSPPDALTGGVSKVAIQNETDLAGLADKFFPQGLTVVVGADVVGLRVNVVAERHTGAVGGDVGVRDDNDFRSRVRRYD